MKIEFQSEECTRCDGEGTYSSCYGYGNTCFKCKGTRKQLSTAGKRALAAYDALTEERCMVTVTEVQKGDKVLFKKDGFTFLKTGFYEIVESAADPLNANRWRLTLTDTPRGGRSVGTFLDSKFRVQNLEVEREIMQEIAQRFKGATLVED